MRSLNRLLALVGFVPAVLANAADGQGRLIGYRTSTVGPIYEYWSFGDGFVQPAAQGLDSVTLKSAWQVSIPFGVTVPIGSQWSVDVNGAYASGQVNLAAPDPSLHSDHYSLSGISDVLFRLTGHLTRALILTIGANAPTGKTSLSAEEYGALRVLAAPPLSFQVPTLANGVAGTAGLVYAHPVGGWALAVGASYEFRGSYTPGATAAGLFVENFAPSDALRFSLAADGLVGAHGMTFAVSADVFTTQNQSTLQGIQQQPVLSKLGPIFTVQWQLRFAAQSFRELTLYAVDRYRTKYQQGGNTIDGSNANYLDAGLRGVLSMSPSTGILGQLNFRDQTGLDAERTLSSAGIMSGAVTLGLIQDVGREFSLQPFVRGQVGRLTSGDRETTASGVAGGLTFGLRF
jgi:hypothetical protein